MIKRFIAAALAAFLLPAWAADTKISDLPTGTAPQNADQFLIVRGSGNFKLTWAQMIAGIGGSFLMSSNNLSDLASASTARTNLGLGTMALETAANYITTASAASTYLTQANAASTYLTQSTAATTYAPLASPTFTGAVIVPNGSTSATSVRGTSSGANAGLYFPSATTMAWVSGGTELTRFGSSGILNVAIGVTGGTVTAADVSMFRGGANSWVFGSGNSFGGGAATRVETNKAVTGIANNTATDVFTVTVPNAAHSASIEVVHTCSLGAGGAIGANEATAATAYLVSIARTAGVNAVATIGTSLGTSGSAAVSGAATITVTGDLSSISGAAGATNTFTVRATVARGSGSSTNHTCMSTATLRNANASGVTIS